MRDIPPNNPPVEQTKKPLTQPASKKTDANDKKRNEKQIDEILNDSFPASDPPPWRP